MRGSTSRETGKDPDACFSFIGSLWALEMGLPRLGGASGTTGDTGRGPLHGGVRGDHW